MQGPPVSEYVARKCQVRDGARIFFLPSKFHSVWCCSVCVYVCGLQYVYYTLACMRNFECLEASNWISGLLLKSLLRGKSEIFTQFSTQHSPPAGSSPAPHSLPYSQSNFSIPPPPHPFFSTALAPAWVSRCVFCLLFKREGKLCCQFTFEERREEEWRLGGGGWGRWGFLAPLCAALTWNNNILPGIREAYWIIQLMFKHTFVLIVHF